MLSIDDPRCICVWCMSIGSNPLSIVLISWTAKADFLCLHLGMRRLNRLGDQGIRSFARQPSPILILKEKGSQNRMILMRLIK